MVDNLPLWIGFPLTVALWVYLGYTLWISPAVDKDRSEHSGHNGTQ